MTHLFRSFLLTSCLPTLHAAKVLQQCEHDGRNSDVVAADSGFSLYINDNGLTGAVPRMQMNFEVITDVHA